MKSLATICLKCFNCFWIESEHTQRNQPQREEIYFNEYSDFCDPNQEPTTNSLRSSSIQKKQYQGNLQQEEERFSLSKGTICKQNKVQDMSTNATNQNNYPEVSIDKKLQLTDIKFPLKGHEEEKIVIKIKEKNTQQGQTEKQLEIKLQQEDQKAVQTYYSPNNSFQSENKQHFDPNSSIIYSFSNDFGKILYTFESDQQIYQQNDFCMQTPEDWSHFQSYASTPNSQVENPSPKKINNSSESNIKQQFSRNKLIIKKNKKIKEILLSKLSETPREVIYQKYLSIQSTQSHKKFRISPNHKYLFPFIRNQNNSVSLVSLDPKQIDTQIQDQNRKMSLFNRNNLHIMENGSFETIKSGSNQEFILQAQESLGFNSTRGINLLPVIFELRQTAKPRKLKRHKSDSAIHIKQKEQRKKEKIKQTQLMLGKASTFSFDSFQ